MSPIAFHDTDMRDCTSLQVVNLASFSFIFVVAISVKKSNDKVVASNPTNENITGG